MSNYITYLENNIAFFEGNGTEQKVQKVNGRHSAPEKTFHFSYFKNKQIINIMFLYPLFLFVKNLKVNCFKISESLKTGNELQRSR